MEFPVKTGAPARSANRVRDLAGVRRSASCTVRRRTSTAPHAAPSRSSFAAAMLSSRLGAVHDGAPHAGHGRRSLAARRLRQAHRLHGQTAHDGARRPRSTRCAAAAPRKRRAISATTRGLAPADAARHSVETARASVYRFDELKSRTDPPARLARLGLGYPTDTSANDVRAGIKIGNAIADGQRSRARSRQSSAQRLHAIAPRGSCAQHRQALRAHGGQGARRSRHAQARHGRPAVGHAGRGRAAATDRAAVPRRGRQGGADRALRQGRHVRHRRHLDQAGAENGRDEVRHVRRRRRARRDDRDRRAAAARSTSSPSSRPARTCRAAAPRAPATSSRACRGRPSRSSTRTPKAG